MGLLYDKYWSQTHGSDKYNLVTTHQRPDDVKGMIGEAKERLATDPEDALKVLNAIAEDYAGNFSVQTSLGEIFSDADQPEAAIKAYQDAAAANPGDHNSYTNLGTEYLAQENYAEAERYLMRGLALAISQSSVDLYNAALSLYHQEMPQVAAAFCRKAIEIEADADTELLLADCLFDSAHYKAAATHYENATGYDDSLPHAYVGLGRSLELEGNFDDAILALNSAQDLNTDEAEAYASLARCYEKMGQPELSQQAAHKYQELSSGATTS